MSLVKAMEYEDIPLKSKKRDVVATAHKNAIKTAESLSSGRLVWLLVKRHRVGLLAIGNVVLVLNTIFPQWFELVKSL